MSIETADAFVVQMEDGSYDVLNTGILQQYAIKADVNTVGSKRLHSDGWNYNRLLEPLYDPNLLLNLLEYNTYHKRSVDVVARDSSGLTYTFKPIKNDNEAPFDNNEITTFLNGLYPSINEILYRRTYDKRSMGYGAIEIIREGGAESKIIDLAHIPAQTLRRHQDGFRVKQEIGTRTVWFTIYDEIDPETNEKVDVRYTDGEIFPYGTLTTEERANELLWNIDYTPKSEYYGQAAIVPSIRAIHGSISVADYNISFFKNYGIPAFAVTIGGDFKELKPGDVGYDKDKTLKALITAQLKEVMKNPHSAMVIAVPSHSGEMPVEIQLQPLSVETKEASFRLYKKDNRDEVLSAHGVPPYRIGVNETGSLGGSNTAEATKIYNISTINPIKASNEADINLLLQKEFGLVDYRFSIPNSDGRDTLQDIQKVKELFNMAAITPNQIIKNFGEEFGLVETDDPYMDEVYLNGNPLSKLWEGGEEVLPEENPILSELENDLNSIEGINNEETDSTNSTESKTIKTAFKTITTAIQRAIKTREET